MTPPQDLGPVYRAADDDARRSTVRADTIAGRHCLRRDCLCLARPLGRGPSCSQDDDANCPYVQMEERGRPVHQSATTCANAGCPVCSLINGLDVAGMVDLGLSKNARLGALLRLSEHLSFVLNTAELAEERRKDLELRLCSLLCCGEARLRFMGNVGWLIQLCPNLRHLRLSRGWGEFWSNLSKVGSAVGHQTDDRCRLATLLFLRHTCVGDADSRWHHYLATADASLERAIVREVFGDRLVALPRIEWMVVSTEEADSDSGSST